MRLQFKHIVDTASDPDTAKRQLAEFREGTPALELDFEKFWATYDNWVVIKHGHGPWLWLAPQSGA